MGEDERRGFWNGSGGDFFAGETRQWTALRVESRGSGIAGSRRLRRGERLGVRMAADYYGVLGVPKSANKQDIKSAYRKLARKVMQRISGLRVLLPAMLAPALRLLGHEWFALGAVRGASAIAFPRGLRC